MTVIAMTGSLFIGVLLNIWFHDQIFFLIAALATFAVVVVWLMTLISHARMKREIKNDGLLPSEFPVPLWPIANYFAMGVIGLVIILIGVVPATRPALIVGAIWVVVLILGYTLFVRGQGRVRKELVDETSPIMVVPEDTSAIGPKSKRESSEHASR